MSKLCKFDRVAYFFSLGEGSFERRSFGEIKTALMTGGGRGTLVSNTGFGLSALTAGVNRGITSSEVWAKSPRKFRKVSTVFTPYEVSIIAFLSAGDLEAASRFRGSGGGLGDCSNC